VMENRRRILQGLGLGTAALAASTMQAAGPASAQQPIKWRVNHFSGETSMFYTLTILPFIERVKQITGGRLELQPFPGGVIAPPLQAYKAVEDGLADAGHMTPLYIVNRDPVNSFYGGHPGGMPPEMLMHWLYNGGGQDLLTAHRRATMGMHSITVSIGPAEIWHSHKIIKSAADLKGLKFRAAGAWAQILNEYFGAAATTVAGSEVYTMLERKGVDVVEWSGPAENLKTGLQNAAPYIIVPGPHANAFMFELIVPTAKWDAVPDDLKAQINAAAKLATLDTLIAWTMADIEAMKAIKAGKAQIIACDPSLIKDVREAGRSWAMKRVAEQEAKGNPWMKRVTESYYGFYDNWLENASYRALD
jgi:TRAP-type mannitol/chloroaromatic compound transport system substrate-binding protein